MGIAVTLLRPMISDDVGTVAGLEARHQPKPWSEKMVADELERENRHYVVATDAEVIVGYGGLMLLGDEAHVTNLLVVPDHRKQGLGTRIMVWLIECAVSSGASHLTLEVRKSNHKARSLYTSLGMVPVGVRPGYYGDDDALIMWAHDIDAPEYLERRA